MVTDFSWEWKMVVFGLPTIISNIKDININQLLSLPNNFDCQDTRYKKWYWKETVYTTCGWTSSSPVFTVIRVSLLGRCDLLYISNLYLDFLREFYLSYHSIHFCILSFMVCHNLSKQTMIFVIFNITVVHSQIFLICDSLHIFSGSVPKKTKIRNIFWLNPILVWILDLWRSCCSSVPPPYQPPISLPWVKEYYISTASLIETVRQY